MRVSTNTAAAAVSTLKRSGRRKCAGHLPAGPSKARRNASVMASAYLTHQHSLGLAPLGKAPAGFYANFLDTKPPHKFWRGAGDWLREMTEEKPFGELAK